MMIVSNSIYICLYFTTNMIPKEPVKQLEISMRTGIVGFLF